MTEPGSAALEGLIPPIRRARDYYLYPHAGGRIIDLYRMGGTALLGYRPPGIVLAQKQRLSEGLSAALPSPFAERLRAQLRKRFPDHPHVRLFPTRAQALQFLAALGNADLRDPALADAPDTPDTANTSGAAVLWRPFLPLLPGAAVVLPLLPDPSAFAPQALCFADAPGSTAPAGLTSRGAAHTSAGISAAALAGSVRACGLVDRGVREREEELHRPPVSRRAKPPQRPHRIAAERAFDEQLAGDPDCVWQRRGPYLACRPDLRESAAYERLVRRCLDHGILIAPDASEPTILPLTMTPGEFTALAKCATMGTEATL